MVFPRARALPNARHGGTGLGWPAALQPPGNSWHRSFSLGRSGTAVFLSSDLPGGLRLPQRGIRGSGVRPRRHGRERLCSLNTSPLLKCYVQPEYSAGHGIGINYELVLPLSAEFPLLFCTTSGGEVTEMIWHLIRHSSRKQNSHGCYCREAVSRWLHFQWKFCLLKRTALSVLNLSQEPRSHLENELGSSSTVVLTSSTFTDLSYFSF